MSVIVFRWLAVFGFIALMTGIGIYSLRRTKTTNDFFLGGRDVGPWITAFAYSTTYFSAVMFVGYAGNLGFSFGIPVIWIAIGNSILGGLFAWLVLAKRTRAMTEHLNVMTMPEFLEARYDCRWFKIVSALIIFVFMIPYSGSVYTGLTFLFVNVLEIDYRTALLVMAGVTGIYLVLGGYFAVALTDFIQGLIMLVGVALMLGYVFGNDAVGGVSGYLTKMKEIDPNLLQMFPKGGSNLFWLVIMTSLGAWGMPQMVQKFCAIRNQKVITTATIVSTIFCLLVCGGGYLVGATSTLYGPQLVEMNEAVLGQLPGYNQAIIDPGAARSLLNPAMKQNIYSNTALIPQIFQLTLPNWMLIIVMLLILSASMSTLSSLVLVSSSSITVDLLKGHFFPEMSRKTSMLVARGLCLVFVVLSLLVAFLGSKWPYLVALMSFSWGTIAGAFLAPYIYGLFWKGVTKAGAWAGLIAGVGYSLGTFFWYAIDPVRLGLIQSIAPRVASIAMLIPLIVVPVVSWLTPKFSEAHLWKVFSFQNEDQGQSEKAA